jgi:hypothetical protein
MSILGPRRRVTDHVAISSSGPDSWDTKAATIDICMSIEMSILNNAQVRHVHYQFMMASRSAVASTVTKGATMQQETLLHATPRASHACIMAIACRHVPSESFLHKLKKLEKC